MLRQGIHGHDQNTFAVLVILRHQEMMSMLFQMTWVQSTPHDTVCGERQLL